MEAEKILTGPETDKAVKNFGQGQTPAVLIQAYGEVKLAALRAQQETAGLYEPSLMKALEEGLEEIISGKWDTSFPLALKQGGAGTSLHMNLCETLALIAGEKTEGNTAGALDDLALYQSTNDTLPTAVSIIMYRFLENTEKHVIRLQEQLIASEARWSTLLMTGRTETMDALPITLGQVFGSWAGSIERDRWRLNKLKERLREIPLGGTAIGTCFSAPSAYVFKACQHLRRITGLPLSRSQNLPDAVAHQDKWAECASGFSLLAGNMEKIAGDIMEYNASSVGELKHPVSQYGSTIMPDKVNPVFCEMITGLCMDVHSRARQIEDYSRRGRWQLNAYTPFLLQSFLDLAESLEKALLVLSDKLLANLKPDTEKMTANLLESPALINTLRPLLGYDKLKRISGKLTEEDRKSLPDLCRALARETGHNEAFYSDWFDPASICSFYKENT